MSKLYFVAIHTEPTSGSNASRLFEKYFNNLKNIVIKANDNNIKLTLMCPAQLGGFVYNNPSRLQTITQWKASGHEIAVHRHSIYHTDNCWDGYTNYTKEEVVALGVMTGRMYDRKYIGNLNQFMTEVYKFNPQSNSGCCNDERDINDLPNEIIYDTCGKKVGTINQIKSQISGVNKDILTKTVKGIKRYWLSHYKIDQYEGQEIGKTTYNNMRNGVFGSIAHSTDNGIDGYMTWIDFLHSKDPNGSKSKTLSQIIVDHLIPERPVQ